jgi:hypothetical protein
VFYLLFGCLSHTTRKAWVEWILLVWLFAEKVCLWLLTSHKYIFGYFSLLFVYFLSFKYICVLGLSSKNLLYFCLKKKFIQFYISCVLLFMVLHFMYGSLFWFVLIAGFCVWSFFWNPVISWKKEGGGGRKFLMLYIKWSIFMLIWVLLH